MGEGRTNFSVYSAYLHGSCHHSKRITPKALQKQTCVLKQFGSSFLVKSFLSITKFLCDLGLSHLGYVYITCAALSGGDFSVCVQLTCSYSHASKLDVQR